MTIPENFKLTLALIVDKFDRDDKSIARYDNGHTLIAEHITYKGMSLVDISFGAKLPTFKSQFYHLLDRKPWANYITSQHRYL